MSTCSNTPTGFPTAALAKQMARNHTVIWSEICTIQQTILKAIASCAVDVDSGQCVNAGGQLCVTIGKDTPMTWYNITPEAVNPYGTEPSLYYNAHIGQNDDCAVKDQIEQVMAHFTNLGYDIVVQVDPDTNETIQWKVCWC